MFKYVLNLIEGLSEEYEPSNEDIDIADMEAIRRGMSLHQYAVLKNHGM